MRWADKKKGSLALDAEAILTIDKDNVRTGAFEGVAVSNGKRAEFTDAEGPGSLILHFEGDGLKAETTDGFDGYWGGMGVTFEGSYARQKLK